MRRIAPLAIAVLLAACAGSPTSPDPAARFGSGPTGSGDDTGQGGSGCCPSRSSGLIGSTGGRAEEASAVIGSGGRAESSGLVGSSGGRAQDSGLVGPGAGRTEDPGLVGSGVGAMMDTGQTGSGGRTPPPDPAGPGGAT
jgi:hypothetical protein